MFRGSGYGQRRNRVAVQTLRAYYETENPDDPLRIVIIPAPFQSNVPLKIRYVTHRVLS